MISLEGIARPKVLVRPCLLLVLGEAPGHGYDLVNRLGALGFTWNGGPGGIYEHLRTMEQASLLHSTISTSGAGPARRVYELSTDGRQMLDLAAVSVSRLSELVVKFLDRYEHQADPKP